MKTYSKSIKFKEGDGFLHGFTTGMVKVKSGFKTAKGGALRSKINFLLQNEWTDFLPIWVWVIDHPEGVFVVDTGENVKVSTDGYFKKEGPILEYINKSSFVFDVSPEEEVGPQLRRLGYQDNDISQVILTHLHLDHFDGLHYFEHTPILINRLEWEKPSFALPSLYPEWFNPVQLDVSKAAQGGFNRAINLTESGEVQLLHTPGHTLGHCSVLVKGETSDYLLASDVTYDQDQLLGNIHAGGHQSFKHAKATYHMIKTYAAANRLVYLPSHDPESLTRLAHDSILTV